MHVLTQYSPSQTLISALLAGFLAASIVSWMRQCEVSPSRSLILVSSSSCPDVLPRVRSRGRLWICFARRASRFHHDFGRSNRDTVDSACSILPGILPKECSWGEHYVCCKSAILPVKTSASSLGTHVGCCRDKTPVLGGVEYCTYCRFHDRAPYHLYSCLYPIYCTRRHTVSATCA